MWEARSGKQETVMLIPLLGLVTAGIVAIQPYWKRLDLPALSQVPPTITFGRIGERPV